MGMHIKEGCGLGPHMLPVEHTTIRARAANNKRYRTLMYMLLLP